MRSQKPFIKPFQEPFQRPPPFHGTFHPFHAERHTLKTICKLRKGNGKMQNVHIVPDHELRLPFHTPRFLNGGGRNDGTILIRGDASA